MEHRDVVVAGMMTAPRYECVTARNQIEYAFQKAGIPLTISGGVFYHQCMQMMMEGVVDKVDYIVTVDFDTICTPEQILRLVSIIAQEDHIDALAGIQPMRANGQLLGSRRVGGEIIWTGEPLKADTAHFGLTVIDAKKLRLMEKPWFISLPDERGEWGDSRTDADVYFWRNWEKSGNSVYIDPGTRIGHLEEMVSVFDEKMELKHVYFKNWKESYSQC